MQIIATKDAPQAIGPYSQAIALQDLIFTSGQIPLTAEGEFLDSDIKAQTEQVCKNLENVLKAANSSLSKVVKTTVFLSDMGYFAEFNQVYEKYFPHKPARSTLAVRELPKGSKVEIECIAIKG